MSNARPLVAAAPGAAAHGMRELEDAERVHLDRLRNHLRSSGAPVDTLDGLGGLLTSAHAAWSRTAEAARPDPGPMISSIAVGVGDLVLRGAPAARWVLRVDGEAPSPAILTADGSAAVVPFADVRRRWVGDEGPVDTAWLERYVSAAAAHLTEQPAADAVPTQRPPADEHAVRHRSARRVSDDPVVRYRTPGELPSVPSPEAQNLALRALDRGLSTAISDGPTPFAMRDDGTHLHVHWFATSPDEALALAEAWVADGVALRAAIGWALPLDETGTLVVPGLGTVPADEAASAQGADHAVVVLASDLGFPGLVVAHRYAAGAPGRPVGEPLVVGPCSPVV